MRGRFAALLAAMGAEAIKELLSRIDLDELADPESLSVEKIDQAIAEAKEKLGY